MQNSIPDCKKCFHPGLCSGPNRPFEDTGTTTYLHTYIGNKVATSQCECQSMCKALSGCNTFSYLTFSPTQQNMLSEYDAGNCFLFEDCPTVSTNCTLTYDGITTECSAVTGPTVCPGKNVTCIDSDFLEAIDIFTFRLTKKEGYG